MRSALPALTVLTLLTAPAAFPQSRSQAALSEFGQLDANPTIFAVFAALNAAGFDADIGSPTNHPLRRAVRENLAKRNIASLDALKRFVRDHRLKDGGA